MEVIKAPRYLPFQIQLTACILSTWFLLRHYYRSKEARMSIFGPDLFPVSTGEIMFQQSFCHQI